MRVKVNVTGVVQGVGFRPFIHRIAIKNQLKGYVRNRGDAGVEILLEGAEIEVNTFLKDLRNTPPLAQIHDVVTTKLKGSNLFTHFTIHKSSHEVGHSGSIIPPDVAICDECLKELRNPSDHRFEYFFVTCTNCGPRFTIFESLPYDRENTAMSSFPMCGFCETEYVNPLNRRFHAQTIACRECGPTAYLTTQKGELIDYKDPIRETGRLLSEGSIVAIKGYGGFHIATSAIEDAPLVRLRQVKYRRQKPFAIMARSLGAIESFAEVSRAEQALLTSHIRPIVLLHKSDSYYLSNLVASRLHNIGVMLPYTGMHFMLFDEVDDAAFVMTSANPPNQPIIQDNAVAVQNLGDTIDYFLVHNRDIGSRCDDSVIRMHNKTLVFIRRSRGYAPTPIMLKERAKRCVVSLGGDLNNTSCILLDNKAFLSQHVGDVGNLETKNFLRNATNHLIHLTKGKVETVVCDLHPKFTTTKLAHELVEEYGWQLVQVQHHYGHIAGLMAEHSVTDVIGICCDGYGYGVDGEAWGGEILLCTRSLPNFKRVAHLEKHPLIGGDLATRYPLRMAAGILHNSNIDVANWLLQNKNHFPHGEPEIHVILQQLEKRRRIIRTTSCGRVLDAVAAVLGLCYERTYEGEPAMKLESVAINGKDALRLQPVINSNKLDTKLMLLEIFDNRKKCSTADLAYSAHVYLAKGLATLAIEKALENNIKTIGFSGGVACNQIFTVTMRKIVEAAGCRFLVHRAVPPGDGGLSFGQAIVGGFKF